jgi:membrane protease YdiL (CAAX protease family)
MGIMALAAAFFLFQVVVTPVLLMIQLALAGEGMSAIQTLGMEGILTSYTRELIISNSVGQFIGLALPAVLLARLHTTRIGAFLRIRRTDLRLIGLGILGVLGMQPVVQWLAQINQALPLPEAVRLFEQTQLEMIRSVLESGMGVSFNLVMLALVPGLCEELLFRGYAQRQFERWGGPAAGVVLSGILFGAYHLRPTQLLPLIVLGTYLAYLTWRTGSLWPAIVVHMAHNGLAVLISAYVRRQPAYDMTALEQAPMPWYAVVGGFVILGSVLYLLHPLARQLRDQREE